MKTHELKIKPEYFNPVISGEKTFEIRKNDRDYKVGDYLILKEYENESYTGNEVATCVSYITSFNQKEDYVVLGMNLVPLSLPVYYLLTDREKKIFNEIISHIHLYGFSNRDVTNTFWEIINTLLNGTDLNDEDIEWYVDYFNKESEVEA